MSGTVGDQLDVLQSQALRPLVHDKGVVDADAINLVDAEVAHLVIREV
jgi:hypothetical protein